MAGPVSIERRSAAMKMVLMHLRIPTSDVARFEVTFTGNSDCFVARIDFPAHYGGGYQIFEGILGYKVSPSSSVMGKNRVTPRFPLRSTIPPQTAEDLREEERQLRMRLDYGETFNNDRVS
jgi:hypothetical protein